MTRGTVLLVGMPFAGIDLPNLSIALVQAHLRHGGFECHARYANLDLATRLDPTVLALADGGPMTGEWLFVPALHGGSVVDDDIEHYARFAQGVLGESLDDALLDRLVEARDVCTTFVDELAERIDWDSYDAVGFSTVFQQTLASLALARRIKERRADLPVLFGGASMHGEMGVAIHERFPEVDVVCTGEADEIVIDLFGTAIEGGDLGRVPGIVHRVDGASVSNEPTPLVTDLDSLPHPDYDDWFAQRQAAGLDDGVRSVMIETSRGCWWGAISHCTFCGLNGATMSYRSKSAERALAEIVALRDRHDADFVTVADNILDMRYLRTLVPRLAELEPPASLYVEVRPKLKHHQVGQLARAGVRSVQPGIESFSDRSLDLMGKATTGLEGIQLLKWCAEYGLAVDWNYLYGLPGETADDHRRAAELVRAARHLPPPRSVSRVQIHRFSPLHERAEQLGFTNVRAESVYRLLFPFRQEVLDRIAYVFEADFADGLDAALDAEDLVAAVTAWISGAGRGGLWQIDEEGGALRLLDQRPWAAGTASVRLTGWRAELYRRCDRVARRTALDAAAATSSIEPERVGDFLAWCRDRDYLASDGDRHLGLAVHHPPRSVDRSGTGHDLLTVAVT